MLAPPEAPDHCEAEEEGLQSGGVGPQELADAGPADGSGCIDQGEDEQGNGDGHDGVVEVDEAAKSGLTAHGSVSQVTSRTDGPGSGRRTVTDEPSGHLDSSG